MLERERELARALRSMMLARWAGVVFAIVQVATYDHMPYPPGVEVQGYLLAALLAVGNVGVWLALERGEDSRRTVRATAFAGLALDVGVVAGVLWVFAFDTESALFILLFILPAEAAMTFGLPGALSAWAASTVLYVGRELYAASAYDAEFSVVSVTFRMGVLLLVSLIMGLLTRNLARRRSQLQQALDDLHAEAEWRNAMIDMLAHDLRSPVGSAVSAMSLLEQHLPDLPAKDAMRLAGNAVRQNRRALRLADDLLDLARARGGRLELRRSRVDVAELLAELIGDLGAQDQVTVRLPPTLHADIDPDRFMQIAANLISNAQKHGRPPVTVGGHELPDGGLVLRVTDSGAGVPADRREQLFQAFATGPRADSIGLGLWVSHTLAVAHGGSLVYDDVDGRPSFVATLPGPDTVALASSSSWAASAT